MQGRCASLRGLPRGNCRRLSAARECWAGASACCLRRCCVRCSRGRSRAGRWLSPDHACCRSALRGPGQAIRGCLVAVLWWCVVGGRGSPRGSQLMKPALLSFCVLRSTDAKYAIHRAAMFLIDPRPQRMKDPSCDAIHYKVMRQLIRSILKLKRPRSPVNSF